MSYLNFTIFWRFSSPLPIGILLSLGLIQTSAFGSIQVPPQIEGTHLVTGKQEKLQLNQPPVATVLVFLSIQCPCSRSHETALSQLAKDYEKKGIRFVGIHSNMDESMEAAREHFKKSNLSFPIIQDSNAKIAEQLEAFRTPHVYIISPKLEILYQGGVDNSKTQSKATQHYLMNALDSVSNGLPIQKSERVLGCEIKTPNRI